MKSSALRMMNSSEAFLWNSDRGRIRRTAHASGAIYAFNDVVVYIAALNRCICIGGFGNGRGREQLISRTASSCPVDFVAGNGIAAWRIPIQLHLVGDGSPAHLNRGSVVDYGIAVHGHLTC